MFGAKNNSITKQNNDNDAQKKIEKQKLPIYRFAKKPQKV